MSSFETIQIRRQGHVATLSLSRPDRLNAVTNGMFDELHKAFDAFDADDSVRAVIVTGEGRAFCAGAEISQGADAFYSEEERNEATSGRDAGGMMTLRIFRSLKPVIAAINGPAVGFGATMTLPMDVRLASENAKFGFVFGRRGIVPEAASSYFLPRVVGINRALRWCLSGALFPASEALQAGLVSEICAPDDLLARAMQIAQEIAENVAPVSAALTRQMLWRGLGMTDPMEAHIIDSAAIIARSQSADAAEGVASFFQKRAPAFTDRVSADMPAFFPWWEAPAFKRL